MSIRDCSRCIATKKSGGQCTRRTCKYPALCWQHTKYEKGLVIRPSRIVGADSGLYADKDFKRNQKITEYTGDEKSLDDYNADDSGYGFEYRAGRIIDARSTQSALGRYINDCRTVNRERKECKGNNTKWSVSRRGGNVSIKAKKNIKKGDELYISYGRGYW
jgi:SET domain-containing protein